MCYLWKRVVCIDFACEADLKETLNSLNSRINVSIFECNEASFDGLPSSLIVIVEFLVNVACISRLGDPALSHLCDIGGALKGTSARILVWGQGSDGTAELSELCFGELCSCDSSKHFCAFFKILI